MNCGTCPICGVEYSDIEHRCDPKKLAKIDSARSRTDDKNTFKSPSFADRLDAGFAMLDDEGTDDE